MRRWPKLVDSQLQAEQVAPRLLDWYRRAGRDLPWRNTRDPYRIWLAEIMLQQTTVAAVIGYYQRFLASFPTLEQLAAAPLAAVIDLWAGLGYYARARNLHQTAILLVEEFAGCFPRSVAELQRLPGIGRSTAGAITALAFDQRAPILDGNVRRILCRLFALPLPSRSSAAEKQLWLWAEQLTPQQQVHDYTQAIMDLGATLCLPRQPRCADCPLQQLCQAHQLGLEQQLPLKMVTKKIPVRHELALLLESNGCYLVRRRATSGLLGGLWEFPTIGLGADQPPEQQLARLMADFTVTGQAQPLGSITHIYSHFRLELQLFRLPLDDRLTVAEGQTDWCNFTQLQGLALHGAHKKALAKLGA